MAKILWNSNAPWSTSGYGNQTALFAPLVRDLGHDVALSCFYGLEGGCIEWNGFTCYPTDHTRFGALLLGEYAAHHGGGDRTNTIVFTLQDVWTLNQAFQALEGCRFVSWCPIDHDPMPPMVGKFLHDSKAQIIAMTEFGRRAIEQQGFEPLGVVPHAVDTKVFKPQPELRDAYRENLHLPKDAFVVGMVANNQGQPSRKSFPSVFRAFKRLLDKHDDAVLYIHADVLGKNAGCNLIELAKICGIPNTRLRTCDQLAIHLGIPHEIMSGVFNSLDVLCMPSMGEGFGIPAIEAQACGVPVILSDFTSMTELCGAGWLVQGERFYDDRQFSWQMLPYEEDIYQALMDAYDKRGTLSEKAVSFAADYDIVPVFDRLKPILERALAPREVPALKAAA